MQFLPSAAPADVGLCPLRAQRLLDALQSDIDRQRLPGAVVLVARRGRVALFEHLGRLDPASGAAMTAVGAVRHHRYRRWQAKQVGLRWTPGLARSAHGTWIAGLGLRF